LQAFVAVGESRSIREAARRLGIGHSAISRHLQVLQEWAHCRLVETGPRGVSLTEHGRYIYERVAPAFATIQDLSEEFTPPGHGRPLEIWCVPGLAARWLTPRLALLRAWLIDRQVNLRPTMQMPDLANGEADAVILYGPPPEYRPDLRAMELCRPPFYPVVSPSWLSLHKEVTETEALAGFPLIHERSDDQWRRWFGAVGSTIPAQLDGPRLWYANLALDAAEHGQGIALANDMLATAALANGRLVRLTGSAAVLDPYVLVTDRRRWTDPTTKRLRDWLERQLAPSAP
jgi:DNA-binding transcriptional LysR family regulator